MSEYDGGTLPHDGALFVHDPMTRTTWRLLYMSRTDDDRMTLVYERSSLKEEAQYRCIDAGLNAWMQDPPHRRDAYCQVGRPCEEHA